MSRATSTTGPLVYWLPLDEAVRRFDVSREALTAAVRRGELEVQAKVVAGDVVASVCSTALATRFGAPRSEPLPRERSDPAAAPEVRERLDGLQGRLHDAEEHARSLELERARLEGRLDSADRVERGLQRYADRLEERAVREREAYEQKLAEAELVRLQLARVVGQLEAEVARLRVDSDREAPRQLAPAERGGRWRRWFRRGPDRVAGRRRARDAR